MIQEKEKEKKMERRIKPNNLKEMLKLINCTSLQIE